MFEPNPYLRITINEICKHEWLTNCASDPYKYTQSVFQTHMQGLYSQSKIYKSNKIKKLNQIPKNVKLL